MPIGILLVLYFLRVGQIDLFIFFFFYMLFSMKILAKNDIMFYSF